MSHLMHFGDMGERLRKEVFKMSATALFMVVMLAVTDTAIVMLTTLE